MNICCFSNNRTGDVLSMSYNIRDYVGLDEVKDIQVTDDGGFTYCLKLRINLMTMVRLNLTLKVYLQDMIVI